MKFYRETYRTNYLDLIIKNKLNAIYYHIFSVRFFKNGRIYNYKNAAVNWDDGYAEFYLNSKCYGNNTYFTKKSWRRFVKLQAFL
jgi:hypothetical protein